MLKLDYRAFQCPHPVVETRKQLLANPGATLQVLVADRVACENISRLAGGMNYQCAQQIDGEDFVLTLSPLTLGQSAEAAAPAGKTVVFCNSDRMGSGDDELGRILLKNFFITLVDASQAPETILFVNSGVKLACAGAETLEALNALACRGVDIASCGLCLDFYHLKDQLQVGRVTNMLDIAETQLQAARILTP